MPKSVQLHTTNQQMPLIGFGLWKVPRPVCADVVYSAIKGGYRLLDGAGDYGNEKEAGDGVQKALKDGLVKREELFITSKLWNTFHAKEHVMPMCKKQLGLWGIKYFDLFHVHFPISLKYVDPSHRYPPEWFGDDGKVHLQDTPFHETWKAMEELVDAGLVKNIGVSNMQGALLLDVLRYARIKPAVLQIEHHPYLVQQPLIDLAHHMGLQVTGYSSFGPQSFIEINMDRGAASLFKHELITHIAARHGKTAAQVILRWATQRGVAVIPKTTDIDKVMENFRSDSFDLTKEELEMISDLNIHMRFNDPVDIDPRLGIFA